MDQQLDQILSACSVSTRATAKTFFPDRFKLPFSKVVHDEIFKLIDGPHNKIAIAAPRGWGKTSIVALGLMARYILFRHTGFICYINKSHDAASLQTENLRRELMTNHDIRRYFGPVKPKTYADGEFEEVFSKKSWVAYDTLVWPRGAQQQVRGVLFKNDRPGLFVIDDLEDRSKIMNDEIRQATKDWFYADVMEAVPQTNLDWKIIYIDTLKHEDSLLQELMNASDWASIRLEACDDNLKSSDPHFVPDAVIKSKWDSAVEKGATDIFYQEHRNLPISTKDSSFKREYFKYYNTSGTHGHKKDRDLEITEAEVHASRNIESVVILDPAKTIKIHSAESAIVGLGIDLTSAKIYVRDIVSEKMYPDEIYDELFGMGTRLGAKVLGIEETSLNEFIRQPIKNEMFRRGDFFELIWLKARGGMKKELRVKELVPYYRGGYIYHNAACTSVTRLEQQLEMFPRSRLWDIMDCLAYVIEMLELGDRYFSPSNNPDDIEAEYDELDYDEPMSNWRIS